MLRANVGHDELQQRALDAPRPGAQVQDAQLAAEARRGKPPLLVLFDPRTAWANARIRAPFQARLPLPSFVND